MSYFQSCIFAVIRGYLVKKRVKPIIEERKKAALVLQSRIRGHLSRRKMKSQKDQRETSAVVIQKGTNIHVLHRCLE